MGNEKKKSDPDPELSHSGHAGHRRAQRHPVPPVYLRYIHLKVKIDDVFVPVVLQNFSGMGILFETQVPFEVQSHADCVISVSQLLSREIAFDVRVSHCEKSSHNTFLVGAEVETTDDATWFNVFRAVHDFILQRQDDVY